MSCPGRKATAQPGRAFLRKISAPAPRFPRGPLGMLRRGRPRSAARSAPLPPPPPGLRTSARGPTPAPLHRRFLPCPGLALLKPGPALFYRSLGLSFCSPAHLQPGPVLPGPPQAPELLLLRPPCRAWINGTLMGLMSSFWGGKAAPPGMLPAATLTSEDEALLIGLCLPVNSPAERICRLLARRICAAGAEQRNH